MAYCEIEDIRQALVGTAASSGTNTAADLPDDALQDAAEQASAIVDSYIDGPYDPTVDYVPAIVLYWTRDIGAYLAMLTWRKSKAPAPDNPVVVRYQNAIGMLQSVATGALTIIGPANVPDQPTVVNPTSPTNFPAGVNLFNAWEFDLFGRGQGLDGGCGSGGYPGILVRNSQYWPGYPT